MAQVKYMGARQSTFPMPSDPPSGRQYWVVAGHGAFLDVDEGDIPWFVKAREGGLSVFEIIDAGGSLPQTAETYRELPSDVDDDTTDITALPQAKAVEMIQAADEVDLRVYYAKEQASEHPRKTVIAAAEKRLRALESN